MNCYLRIFVVTILMITCRTFLVAPTLAAVDNEIGSIALEYLLEMLVKSTTDLTDRIGTIQQTLSEQNNDIARLNGMLLASEQNCLKELYNIHSKLDSCNNSSAVLDVRVVEIAHAFLKRLDNFKNKSTHQGLNLKANQEKRVHIKEDDKSADKIETVKQRVDAQNRGIYKLKNKILTTEEMVLEKVNDFMRNQTSDSDTVSSKMNAMERTLKKQANEISALESYHKTSIEEIRHIKDDVHQCNYQINTLQQRLEQKAYESLEVDRKLLSNEQKCMDKIEAVKSEMNTVLNTHSVSFSARVSPSYTDIAPWETIKFTQVETNIGNAYSATTGEFTSPLAGIYVFYSNILAAGKKSIETSLQVNGNNKLWLYSAGDPHYGSGSNFLVIHLNKEDKVKMVKHGPWGTKPFYIHHVWSTFSGFLLTCD